MEEGDFPLAHMGLDDVTILARIGAADDTRLASLSRELLIAKSTMTSIIKRLEKAGYLKRHVSCQDRREFVLQLTETGRSLLREHERYELLVYSHMLQGLRPDEQSQLVNLLKKGCGMGEK
jgi:DNA-binding MarR family transcriptional regulator